MKIEGNAMVAASTRVQLSSYTSHVRHAPYFKYRETVYIVDVVRKRATLCIGVC